MPRRSTRRRGIPPATGNCTPKEARCKPNGGRDDRAAVRSENLRIARLNHDALLAGNSSSGLANAQSQLLSAEQALATALAGPTDDQIAAAQTAVAQAQLGLKQAQLNQETHLAGTTLTAPIAGTIMSVNGHLGAPAATGPFIMVADLSRPAVEITLDETNLDKLAVGGQVEVVFSALPAETYAGTVVQIDPQLVASGGLNLVRALVQLEGSQDRILPAGLTASVNVIGTSNRIVRVFLPLVDEGTAGRRRSRHRRAARFQPGPGHRRLCAADAHGVRVRLGLVPRPGRRRRTRRGGGAGRPAGRNLGGRDLVSDSVEDVMAVPVSALVALLEGGYAVEVKTGARADATRRRRGRLFWLQQHDRRDLGQLQARRPGGGAMSETTTVLDVINVNKSYPTTPPVHALRDVSFCVTEGELVSVVGPSGSGKSTLLHLMGTLDRPTSGDIVVAGHRVSALSDRELSALRASPHRLCLSEIPPAEQPDHPRQRGRRPALHRALAVAEARAGRDRAPPGGHGPPPRPAIVQTLRRRNAAGRHRPGLCRQSLHRPGRRADRQPGQQEQRRHCRVDPRTQRRRGHHRRDHPQSRDRRELSRASSGCATARSSTTR